MDNVPQNEGNPLYKWFCVVYMLHNLLKLRNTLAQLVE
jgi:hypothetical protein